MKGNDYNKQHYEEFWNSVSYFKNSSPGNRWMFDLFEEILKPVELDEVHSILDIGCGEGTKTAFLSKRFPNATTTGVDFTESGIQSANNKFKNNQNLKFICIDANDRSVWSEPHDLIFCSEVLEHVEDWKSLVDQFAANSKKYILLSFPVGKMRKYEVGEGHLRNFKRDEMEEYLSKHHFKPLKIFYAGFPFYSPIGRDLANIKWLFKFYDKEIRRVNKPTLITKIYSSVFYILFRYCSTKKHNGDQFIGLFYKNKID